MFGSDDDDKPKAKPQFVKVQPKGPPASVLAKQKEQAAPKKKGKVEKAAPAAAAAGEEVFQIRRLIVLVSFVLFVSIFKEGFCLISLFRRLCF